MVIKRDVYLNKLIKKRGNGAIKIITGLRRSGKSFLLFELFYDYLISQGTNKQNIIKIALDDDRNAKLRNADNLSEYLYSKITSETERFYVLLDEAQFAVSDEEAKHKGNIRLYGILNGLLRLKTLTYTLRAVILDFFRPIFLPNFAVAGMKFM